MNGRQMLAVAIMKEALVEAITERMVAHDRLYYEQHEGDSVSINNAHIFAAKSDGMLLGTIRGLRCYFTDQEIQATIDIIKEEMSQT